MAEQSQIPKWQEQVEAILRGKFKGGGLEAVLDRAIELLEKAEQVERPLDEDWDAVRAILHLAIENLTPLSSAMVGFQLGVAYEKWQNANRA